MRLISSVEDLIGTCDKGYFNDHYGRWIFRGISRESYKLIPSVGRQDYDGDNFLEFEKSLIETFKRQAFQYTRHWPMNEFEWLALGQHHGLPTRLLDWSANPLVSLFFAVSADDNHDGKLLALYSRTKLTDESLSAKNPLKVERVQKVVARNISERMFHQEGVFTIHLQPQIDLREQLRSDWKLEEMVIPASRKEAIRHQLNRIGINKAKLFPSLEGLSEHLAWQHSNMTAKLR